jgi:predicted dinucleotide-binding enzyme
MKIGIIGAGNIGATLARKWSTAGHQLMIATRDPSSPRAQGLQNELANNARLGSPEDTVAFGDVVLFAIPGRTMPETVQQLGKTLDGKLVIDATNAVGNPIMNSVGAITSAAPTAQVFRAFNSLPWETFADPQFGDVQADLFYCGPAERRDVIERLIRDVGLEPVYVGELNWITVVDPIAGLFFALSQRLGRGLAFKLLKR